MLLGDNAAVSPTRARNTGSKSPLDKPSRQQPRLGARATLVPRDDLGMKAIGTDLGRHIADAWHADLNGTHAHTNRPLRQMAIPIAAILTCPLIPASAEELVNLCFKRVLEHLARSLAYLSSTSSGAGTGALAGRT
jgi:hypothetical protein